MSKSIVVVGAGIAGLSAGCYGQMNGYTTHIFELHDKPGGLCTSWKRKGYLFDGCIHWLVGTCNGSHFNQIWHELGALQGTRIVDHDEFVRVEGVDGKAFTLYTDVDRLERHMRELTPADGSAIGEFCRAIRRTAELGDVMGSPLDPPEGLRRVGTLIRMLPYLGDFRKYSRMSVQDFAARFSDPFLRQAFVIPFDLLHFPMAAMLMTLAWMYRRDAGYPVGGSLEFARSIERRYLELGGEVHYGARVAEILVGPGKGRRSDEPASAVGVRLADGSEHHADVVISAADGHATIFDMLGGRYLDDTIRGYYDQLPIFPPIIQVSLGVARDLSGQTPMVNYPLDPPIMIAGQARKRMGVRHFCYDPTVAPAGRSVITVMFDSSTTYWEPLCQDRERYDSEKQQVATIVIDQLEKHFPGITSQIEAVDVATPLTYERYTGNWQGSMEGWMITPKTMEMMTGKGMEKTLPGLDNFYMAGQWVEPGGGVPTAALSGRNVIRRICKRDGRRFATTS